MSSKNFLISLLLLLTLIHSVAAQSPKQRRRVKRVSHAHPAPHVAQANYGYDSVDASTTYEAGDVFCDDSCGGGCGGIGESDMALTASSYLAIPRWSAGVEFTLLRPHFDNNPAFSTLDSDGDTFRNISQTQFHYNRELSPRVWLEGLGGDCYGIRAIWWNYDHPADTMTGTPPASGFGEISHPTFGTVDLSTTVPNSQFTAMSDINATTIDLEVTKSMRMGQSGWLTSFGLRYGEIEQTYDAELRSEVNVLQGTINYAHRIEGIGPTVAIRTQRPWTNQLSVFAVARGSLLFGDGESTLNAIEDQDLDTQLTTTETLARDDLLPIGELQLGMQWTPPAVGMWTPYLHIAMEGQLWDGVGNASSEEGNLGFFGFNVALGFDF